jgi:predicted RNA-binding Zn-ribbon protein involved in translation (DUF1610 family)
MKRIYRFYADTEVTETATNVKCPYCGNEWLEPDSDECGKTYIVHCEEGYNQGCGKKFEMHFDAS